MPKHKPEETENSGSPEEVIPRNVARLGSSLYLKGELSGEEDVVIEGHFRGKINLGSHNILIREGGNVEGDIQVNNIIIKGNVKGNINAFGKVLISEEGQLKGDISAPTISIMDGAKFQGSVKMEKDNEPLFPPKKETGDLFPEKAIPEEQKGEETEAEKEEGSGDGSSPEFSDS